MSAFRPVIELTNKEKLDLSRLASEGDQESMDRLLTHIGNLETSQKSLLAKIELLSNDFDEESFKTRKGK
jgi:hypothetical protein